jgi:hypothetical protein
MEFYAAHPHKDGCHAYLINLPPVKILFAGGFNLKSLLHYTPHKNASDPYKQVHTDHNRLL